MKKKAPVFIVAGIIFLAIAWYISGLIVPSDSGFPSQLSSDSQGSSNQSTCGNSRIDYGENCSNCPSDVKCKSGETCLGGVCKQISLCGNGWVDSGETCSNCPADVKCKSDEKCVSGKCIVKGVEYTFIVWAVTPIVTGALYFDQEFYPHFTQADWAKVEVQKNGSAVMKNAELTVDFGDWADEVVKSLGSSLSSKTVYINPRVNTRVFVKNKTTKTVKFTLTYYDSQDKKHTETKTKYIILLPPQYMTQRCGLFSILWSGDKYKPFLQFYDSRIKSLAQDLTRDAGNSNEAKAKAIFDGLGQKGLRYQSDPEINLQLTYYTSSGEKTESWPFEYTKFPYQTYSEKGGDCEDMAILMASLLQSININSYFIRYKTGEGGHAFLSFDGDSGNSVKLEATLISKSSYTTAVRRGEEHWEEARKGWWDSVIVREAFDDPDIRRIPALEF